MTRVLVPEHHVGYLPTHFAQVRPLTSAAKAAFVIGQPCIGLNHLPGTPVRIR